MDISLISKIQARDSRTLAKCITAIESHSRESEEILPELYKLGGKAHVVGFTGPPGAGKSTLVDSVAKNLSDKGKNVAVLAVDPSSPFSGGAVLGDRIRMAEATERMNVFMRSLATRGALGGLSDATFGAVILLDAAGFDYVLVETVGVGQAEVDIARVAETSVVVLVPGLGDTVQLIKAGIIEIADIFVINKADREGAIALEKELLAVLGFGEYPADSWAPKVQNTVATRGTGVPELLQKLSVHRDWAKNSGAGLQKKKLLTGALLDSLLRRRLDTAIHKDYRELRESLLEECVNRKTDPYSVAEELWGKIKQPR